jgi:hypothetical protein
MEQLVLAWLRLQAAQMEFLAAWASVWPLPQFPTRAERAVTEISVSGDKRHVVISADFYRR